MLESLLKEITQPGGKLAGGVNELRNQGKEPNDASDLQALNIILQLIEHYKKYALQTTSEHRKKILYNICFSVCLLSDKAKPGEAERFKERYVQTDASIWRNLEFLLKFLVPVDHRAHVNNYPINDQYIQKILDEDMDVLEQIIKQDITETLNQKLTGERKNTYQLKNTYILVNYWRDKESLKKILEITKPEVLSDICPVTSIGKQAIFRILQVIGEYVTQKNLSGNTKKLSQFVEWQLLINTRNKLAHSEWYLALQDRAQDAEILLSDQDATSILKKDIPLIKQHIETLSKTLQSQDPDKHYAPAQTAEKPDFTAVISGINGFCIDLEKEAIIDSKQADAIKKSLSMISSDEIDIFSIINKNIPKEKISHKLQGGQKIGQVIGVLQKQFKQEKNKQSRLRGEEKKAQQQPVVSSLVSISAFEKGLPDEQQYWKRGGEGGRFAQTIQLAIMSIDKVEKIISNFREGQYLKQKVGSFSEDRQINLCKLDVRSRESIINQYNNLAKRIYRSNKEDIFGEALEIVIANNNPNGQCNFAIPERRRTINTQDIARGTHITRPINGDELATLLKVEANFIIKETVDYANFIKLVQGFRADATRKLAMQYRIASIYPILKHIPGMSAGVLKLLELKYQRNFEEHDNMYVRMSGVSEEEFLVRYASVFIKDTKPQLEKLAKIITIGITTSLSIPLWVISTSLSYYYNGKSTAFISSAILPPIIIYSTLLFKDQLPAPIKKCMDNIYSKVENWIERMKSNSLEVQNSAIA